MRNSFGSFRRLWARVALSLALAAGLALPAHAATVTVVSTGVVSRGSGTEALFANTTVATFTAAQNIATLTVGKGLWSCVGTAYQAAAATQTGGTVSISTTSGAHAASGVLLASLNTVNAAAATTGYAFTTGPGIVAANVPTNVYFVMTNPVTTTVTAGFTCTRISK